MTTRKPLPGDKRRPEQNPACDGIPARDEGRHVGPWSDWQTSEVRKDEVIDLIRQADQHELGRSFLEQGAQDAVAATFGVHAFLVDAAREHLSRH